MSLLLHRPPRGEVRKLRARRHSVRGRAGRQDHRRHVQRPPGGTWLVTPEGASAAQEIAEAAPASAHVVVKAFNAVFGNVLAQDRPLDVLIAGDDAQANASVSAFIESLGLRPLDVGPLAMARWLEGTGLVMMGLGRHGVGNFNFALDVHIPG
jgi:8-hydroxy-5-deazaflavin:NADPH oxidoreductase